MTDRVILRLFYLCLFACAALALGGIWFGEHALPPAYFQTTASLFIIGLTLFLVWFTRTLRDMRERMRTSS